MGKDTHPVVYVSWNDAMAYCGWLAEVTGNPYTLTSEAEWEKAARGTDGRIYPWGNMFDKSKCNVWESGIGDTTSVDRYPQGASPYGVLDMAGNVWEWTRSLWGTDGREPDFNYPYWSDDGRENLEEQALRVARGASWNRAIPASVRCAFRNRDISVRRFASLGFRVARSSL